MYHLLYTLHFQTHAVSTNIYRSDPCSLYEYLLFRDAEARPLILGLMGNLEDFASVIFSVFDLGLGY